MQPRTRQCANQKDILYPLVKDLSNHAAVSTVCLYPYISYCRNAEVQNCVLSASLLHQLIKNITEVPVITGNCRLGSVAVLTGVQGGHGPRPCTFGNPEGAPQLRKNRKEITGKNLNTPLRHNDFKEKELEE